VAIKTDGTLWVWGLNTSAQLGNNRAVQTCTPVTTFAGGTTWKIAQSRENSTIAIKEDGTLWAWGSNAYGQLGTNDTFTRSTPVTTFAGGNTWKQVSGGGGTSAAVKTDGTLWLWGFGGSGGSTAHGILGMNDNLINRSTPSTTFAGGTNWKYVSIFNSAYAVQTGTDTRNLLS
jgi:alpha-tubulin suppressor-like RCC1 family protein